MFTGIVETVGRVVAVREVPGGRRLTINAGAASDGTAPGASLAVNGVCLTVAAVDGPRLDFDVITETLSRTNLGRLQVGHRVNLERSLRPDSRLDGHFVQGHVDGTARITEKRATDRERILWFEPQERLVPYMIPKGSVAIDGVSLTIAELRDRRFSVALIPTTIQATTLGDRNTGDAVNVETDLLVRAVVHWLQQTCKAADDSGLTLAKLQEQGFA
jgi:riboflavin synthase